MKRLLLLQLLLFPLTGYAQWGAHSQWEPVSPIQYAGLAKQGHSTVVATATNGYIYISNDFGNTWLHQCLDDTMQLGDIEFFDSLHGIVNASVTEQNYIVVPVIFLTSDGGATWSRIQIPVDTVTWRASNANIHRLAYPSIDTFYACDDAGIVWRTTDRGTDWLAEIADSNMLNGIYFLDSKTGFIVGTNGCFSKTTDAGQTWTRQNIGAGDSTELYGMDFYSTNIGLVYGFGYTYITTDGGTNWLFRPTPLIAHNTINTARWVNDHHFFALTNPAYQVYELMGIDSEMSATIVDSIIYTSVSASIYDPENGGLAVGYDGLIMRSPDGIIWKPVSQYTGGGSLPIVFDNVWYSLGSMFERSTDEGYIWKACSFDTTFQAGIAELAPTTLNFSDSLHGLALNSVLRSASIQTTDGGLTWTNAGLSNAGPSNYLAILGHTVFGTTQPGSGYGKVGDTIYLWKSTDDGRSFAIVGSIPLDLGSSPYLNEAPYKFSITSMDIIDDNTAYVFATVRDTGISHDALHTISHSLLYLTTNGGSLWTRVTNAPMLPTFGCIYFHDKNNGFIGCDSGALYRTIDGGVTWSRYLILMSTGSHYITAINFRDSVHGYLGTNNRPNIFATSDGGLNWKEYPSDGIGAGNAFLFIDSNTTLANIGGAVYRQTINPLSDVRVEFGLNPFLFIRYYPSPVTNDFHAQFDGTYTVPGGRIAAGLYDILGREVLDLSSLANQGNNGVSSFFTADVSILHSGVYSLHYQLGSSSLTKGLIIIH